jgi:1-deoxy-D-xylulose-5-phosphate synthase
MSILSKINEPRDLKKLNIRELTELAAEIREVIINTVSKTGGHLAPNLGVVELTIALHRALDCPKDKIVWDVGHQCYVHKLLTGRYHNFQTLRQYGGISGFPKRSESEFDIFDTGHASNSVSIALGLAEASRFNHEERVIVAVMGDGALTGGMAYEALNQVGHLGTKLIVILNDNEMSISCNVGAMSSYLARLRLDPTYNRISQEIETKIKKIPAIGEHLYAIGEHIKESFKALLVPGMIFEELGFKYIGPINGHNIEEIERSISLAKNVSKPVLLHVLTKKGLGYKPAEENPDRFHGTSPFIVETGEVKDKGAIPSYTKVFGHTLCDIARENEKIVAITAAMATGTGLDLFREEFPDRFYDVGIAEQHAVTFAAGLAVSGLLPVVAIYSTFLQRAYDQLIQDVCLQDLPVILAIDRAGIVGEDGPTHHGVFDLSYLRHMPGLVIMAPKDEGELRHMLYTATLIRRPVAIRYPRGAGVGADIKEKLKTVEIGKGEVLKQGEEVCLLAIGRMVGTASEAAELLERRGISTSVVNMRFVKPLDEEILRWAASSHPLVVTVEENSLIGGFGSGVLEFYEAENIPASVTRIGIPDEFVPHGSTRHLLTEIGLDAGGIAYTVSRKISALKKPSRNRKSRARDKIF